MNNTDILALGVMLASGCTGSAQGLPQGVPDGDLSGGDRPNFVIMLADDCSWNDLGCYGSPDAITPNIDRLATEGMKFTSCFQQASMSSPTRHALYTGMYPVKSGAYPNHTFVYDHVNSFVQYFGEEGYRTALIGKQHVGPRRVFSYEYLGDYQDKVATPEDDFRYEDIAGFIRRSGDDPFFLVVASREPHTPHVKGDPSLFDKNAITLPPMYVDTDHMRAQFVKYLAEINFLDRQVGNVLGVLGEEGVLDNTVFIFLSEQGNQFPFAKWTCYRQGLQSAMIVRWPGAVEAGTVSDALVEYVDVLPTCMEIAGIPASEQIEGESFRRVLKGETDIHKPYSYGLQTTRGINKGSDFYGIRTVRDGRYSYVVNLTPDEKFQNAFTENPHGAWQSWLRRAATGDEFATRQVFNFQYRPAEELYDMQADPYEMNNLLLSDPENPEVIAKRAELREKLLLWMEQQGDLGQQTELDAPSRITSTPNA